MNTYIELLEKALSEFLGGLQKAQAMNLATLASVKEVPVPSPVEIVERTFAFTNQLLETRKAYMLKLAELATQSSKN
jgi:hypothetical protein